MRLIDADAIKIPKTHADIFENCRNCKLLDAEQVKELIDSAPTIDAVPVIRCKDCKWYGRVDKRRFYRGSDCLQKRIDTIVPERDFCSRGERKES